jgi:TIR domain
VRLLGWIKQRGDKQQPQRPARNQARDDTVDQESTGSQPELPIDLQSLAQPAKRYDAFVSYSHSADGELAPALQAGLQRLGKPWNRRRALEVFRDATGLGVTAGLWPSICAALDGARWFVLLCSPEAAHSIWVNREIERWLATKSAETIMPVVTDGTWKWDELAAELDATATAVPPVLRSAFHAEPRYLDLTWARREHQLTLRNARFRDQVAELAAPIHGVAKDDLEGVDIREQARVRRLTRERSSPHLAAC